MSLELLALAKDYSATPAEANLRMLLGGLLTADWQQSYISRGYGYHVDVGAFSTPIVGGGNGTVLDQDQPEFGLSVASGYTLVPIRFAVNCQVPLLAADSDEAEILIAVDRASAWAGDGTFTTETPLNMRTSATPTAVTGLSCFSAATGNITNPALGHELAHEVIVGDVQGIAANAMWNRLSLVYEPKFPPFIVGPAAVYGYWGGTVATTGFANLDFLVIPTTLISGLT